MRMVKELFALLRQAGTEWYNDNVFEMGAALAYYSIFSIAPLFLVAIAIAGSLFGQQAAEGQVVAQLRDLLGPVTAEAIEGLILHTRRGSTSTWAMIASGISVLVGASWVFGQLQESLNFIWKVRARPNRGLWGLIGNRLLSFLMVFGTGILLLISLVFTTALSALGAVLPAESVAERIVAWRIINGVISFAIITLLFAMIFRHLPDVKIAWSDVWVGAAFTALLFTAGKYLIGLYLGSSDVATPYGAAGSLVLILLWVYYSALIVLFGAEFTRVWADKYGTRLEPSDHAMRIEPCDEVIREGPRDNRVSAPGGPRG